MSSRIEVNIDRAGLEAQVDVVPGPPGDEATLREALQHAGVIVGISVEAVRRLGAQLGDEAFRVQGVVVATAEKPEGGRPEALELAIDPDIQPGNQRSNGTMNFRSRGLLKPVSAGKVVARRIPAHPSRSGRTVRGQEILAPAIRQPKLAALGPGVAERPQGGDIVARRGGVLSYRAGESLDVLDSYEHVGDVDLRSGNLESFGMLTIKGNVSPGFAAYGAKGLTVVGCLGGSLYSRGDLRVSTGVRGHEVSIVSAGGTIEIGHAEGARLESSTRIVVHGGLVTSQLRAPTIRAEERVHGGVLLAEEQILILGDVGSDEGVLTRIRVAEPMPVRLEYDLPQFRLMKALEEAQRKRGVGASAAKYQPQMSAKAKERRKEALRRQEIETAERRTKLMSSAFIEVHGKVHPGVVIEVGDVRTTIQVRIEGIRFFLDADSGKIRRDRLEPRVA